MRLSWKSFNFVAAKLIEDEIVYFLGYWGIDGPYGVDKLSFLARSQGHSPTNRSGSNGGTWQRQPLTIDGSDKDWTKPLPYTVKSEQLNYAVTNDGQNLYILMSTHSPQEAAENCPGRHDSLGQYKG